LDAATALEAGIVVIPGEDRVQFRRAIGVEPVNGDGHRIKCSRHDFQPKNTPRRGFMTAIMNDF